MPKKGNAEQKGRYNFLIDSQVYEEFSLLCEELGLVRSKHVEKYMQQFVAEHRELLEKLKRGAQHGK